METVNNKITIDALAAMFKLPSYETIEENNREYIWNEASGAYGAYLEDLGLDQDANEPTDEQREAAEEAQLEAEQRAQTALYNAWYDATLYAAEQVFEEYRLALVPYKIRRAPKDARVIDLRILPSGTGKALRDNWKIAADRIRILVNGVGYFHFQTLGEFLASGPYTPRQATLEHLAYLPRHSEVYGSTPPQRYFESHFSL